MKTRAAILRGSPGKWEVTDVDLDAPRFGEVLVQYVASGLCHSDAHATSGDVPFPHYPLCGGHEGSGIVREVGPGVEGVEVGDHVVTTFVPSCGKCRWCASGQQHICDLGANYMTGAMTDGSYRMHLGDEDIALMAGIGTFAEFQVVDEDSLIKVSKDLPLDVICIVACGVPTGWGSATNAACIEPGDVVIVMGCGGVGINAVQGAAHKGAGHVIAVDPQQLKRTTALRLGATAAYDNMDEATEFARSVTNGQGADSAIVTTSVIDGTQIAECFSAIRKAGTVVVTSLGNFATSGIPVNILELVAYQKRIQGALYGNGSPRRQVPQLLEYYRTGAMKLDELITTRYTLGEVNEGYADMMAGRNIRGVIDFGDL